MNKIFSLLILSCCCIKTSAKVLLVNNATSGAGQFTVIDSAMAHASANDTIYISGSNVTYSTFTITKSIVVIGPGSYSNKQNAFPAKVSGIKFNSNLSNIKIKGLYLLGDIDFSNKTAISQVEISGNYSNYSISFSSASNFSNFNIANNIFAVLSLYRLEFVSATGMSNFLIQNNIIYGSIRSFNAVNGLISNNVFVNIANAFDYFSTSFFSNAIIKDNIFYNANPNANTVGCTYTNNLSYSTTTTYTAMNGTGNLDNVNPNFVYVQATGSYTTALNFHLQSGSPAIGVSTIGGDLGFYGGTFHADVSGETQDMPVIRKMDVLNLNLPQNGNVNVKVRSTKAR